MQRRNLIVKGFTAFVETAQFSPQRLPDDPITYFVQPLCFGQFHTDFQQVQCAPGIAIGNAVVMQPPASLEGVPEREAEDVTTELMVLDRAINAVRADIRRIGEDVIARL